jgi:DNA-binding GntR family transcriptional regulator
MTLIASNNNLDDLNKSYEEAMLKLSDKASSQFKQNMDNMREKNLKNLRHEVEQINQALDKDDLFKAQYHAMNARFYKYLSGL